MEKKNEIKKTAFSFCIMGLLALANLFVAYFCVILSCSWFNLVMGITLGVTAAKKYADLQVLKAEKAE